MRNDCLREDIWALEDKLHDVSKIGLMEAEKCSENLTRIENLYTDLDNFIKVNRGKISNREVYGSFIAYTVNIGGDQFNIIDKHNSQYHIGDVADVYLNPFEINYFDNISGNNLIYNRLNIS